MLTQTSESAIRVLIFIAQQGGNGPIGHRHIAERLGESPTYMAKVTSRLVRANILRAHRGAMGGVTLGRPAEMITLLSIVEACQGVLVGDYCQVTDDLDGTCAYHQAASELHNAISGVLSGWTLAQLVAKPGPSARIAGKVFCRMRLKQIVAARTGGAGRAGAERGGTGKQRKRSDKKRPRR